MENEKSLIARKNRYFQNYSDIKNLIPITYNIWPKISCEQT